MSRYGMFGSRAPGRNYLNPLSPYDGILGRDPSASNSFLSGVVPERPSSNSFLSGVVPEPSPQPRYNRLTALLMDPPKPVIEAFHTDRITYNFRVLSVRARPWQKHCVYAFVCNGWPVYVGKAYDASTRFGSEHNRRAEALALGADALWVTEVTPEGWLDEAEQHLIEWCCPVLNDKHNPLSFYR
jgi:hypothetical protein